MEERFLIITPTQMVRVAVDEIVYVKADGNYCDLVLINGRKRSMTFQLHYFEDNLKRLKSSKTFIRVGRSLIVNRDYVQFIDLSGQFIIFGGKHIPKESNEARGAHEPIYTVRASREALSQLKEELESAK
ncbi:MAG: LytTR family transcriptional regulator [Prevotella sp.]|nr:LytTR family transcriptional regulator [Prevotella sp.]